MLKLSRGQWSIENRSHYVRDWTNDENRSRIRTHQGPQTMACLRNLAIGLVRLPGENQIAAVLRHLHAKPEMALDYLGI